MQALAAKPYTGTYSTVLHEVLQIDVGRFGDTGAAPILVLLGLTETESREIGSEVS